MEDHYVLLLVVEKVTHEKPDTSRSYNSTPKTEAKRHVHELAKIAIKETTVEAIKEKAKCHLDLITDGGI